MTRASSVASFVLVTTALLALGGTAAHAAGRDPKAAMLAAARSKYPDTTTSIYEHGTSTSTLYSQGCSAGAAAQNGVVILDFGRPAERSNNYGTIDFNGNFDTDSDILTGMEQFAQGYHDCLSTGSSAKVSIARGTNNSCSNDDKVCCPKSCGSQPYSFYSAGKSWATWVDRLQTFISSNGWKAHETASAADDAEPAWDPPTTTTDQFLSGFAARFGSTYPMWDYGSLEPGYWSSSQEYQVAYGYAPDVPFPEIYGSTNAQQWEALDLWAVANEGKAMTIWGVTSEYNYGSGYNCGLTAHQAYDAMLSQLQSDPSTYQSSITYVTDIPCNTAFDAADRTIERGPPG
jgi:hypothetical protein